MIKTLTLTLLLGWTATASTEPLEDLAREFFAWRATTQPATGDDILRVERPGGWVPDVSPQALSKQRHAYGDFKRRLEKWPLPAKPPDRVDYWLLRAAIERVHWELDVLRQPFRNPDFYVHQTLGVLYELLLIHTPMTPARARNIIIRIQSFRQTLQHARENLQDPVGPFADIALANLENISPKMKQIRDALKPQIEPGLHNDLNAAVDRAVATLEAYARWLRLKRPAMSENFSIGRDAYIYFLKNVALIPYSPEELIAMGRLAWNRSVAFEAFEMKRNAKLPPAPVFDSAAAQIEQSTKDEKAIRDYLENFDIMTVPAHTRHYRNLLMPPHIAPLAYMGVVDDLTSPTRLDEDGVSYIPEPHPDLSFFRLASAKDPRPIIVHEGVPGHYFQLVQSWRNPRFTRRHFIDSGPIEGIGFYVEEMLMAAGLFDDRPRTREIIYRFMRLRALRVEVDVQLALGGFTIAKAGAYLARTVPMDEPTAIEEAGFFAYNPGQAISYQIGKLQILQFLADARIHQGDRFQLRAFHDYLMRNGNVPIALQRYEYLGLEDELPKLMGK